MSKPKPKSKENRIRLKSKDDWKNLPAEVLGWFKYAVKNKAYPMPSAAACETFADEFRRILIRYCNAELDESKGNPFPFEQWLIADDGGVAELKNKRVEKFRSAANQLLVEAEVLENFFGDYRWTDNDGTISLSDIQCLLRRIGAAPIVRIPSPKEPGRPKESSQRETRRSIARLIKKTMIEAGHNKNLSEMSEESVTSIVGAKLVNWAFILPKRLTAKGFATSMKNRNRTKKKGESLDEILASLPPLQKKPN